MKKSGKRFYNVNIRKILIINLTVILVVCAYYVLLGFLGISCPIRLLIGHNCPTCGTTTAILSLLKGDINGYFTTQPFALLLVIVFGCEVNRSVFKRPIIIDIATIIVAVANFIYYLIKII